MLSAPAPLTQHLPMPRATTAAWLVMPPRAVKIPSAALMPAKSSGLVSIRTITTCLPSSCQRSASSAKNTTWPQAAPGLAGKPRVRVLAFANASLSNTGWSNSSNLLGSQRSKAVFSSISPSYNKSIAIFTLAVPVRLPLRVCKNHKWPSCTVNSMSCMSW